jgi:hypothetical protein
VSLEFTIDDTGSAMEKDTLLDITFFVPDSSKVHGVPGDEETAVLPAAALTKDLLAKADVGAAAGDTAIATFTDVACLVRGHLHTTLEVKMSERSEVAQLPQPHVRYMGAVRDGYPFLQPGCESPLPTVPLMSASHTDTPPVPFNPCASPRANA